MNNTTKNIKQWLIVRKDLHMKKGKAISQCSHASMKAILDRCSLSEDRTLHMDNVPEPMYLWLTGIFTKVVLGVDSEEEMLSLYSRAIALDIPCSLITDAGLTVFNGVPTNTCIAIGPEEEHKVNKITGHLKLY